MTEASTPTENRRKVAELIKGVRIAMLTTMDQTGRLVSRPMTTQDVEFDGDDRAKLEEQWNRMTDAFLEGGPDNPDNVLILVEGESAEYWESPGGPVSRLANLAKSLVKKEPMDGENAVVDL